MKSRKPKVVAIVGLIGSGKSSVSKYLAKLIGAKSKFHFELGHLAA